jgi:hypothetical protein
MKINSLMIAAMAMASATAANAVDHVYFTGSTAARAVVNQALITATNGSAQGMWDTTPTVVGYGNTTLGKCTFLWISNSINGNPVILKTHWSGSEAGISDVTGLTVPTFADDTATEVAAATQGSQQGFSSPSAPGTTETPAAVDLAMADNAISFSLNPGSSAVSAPVGVVPFEFVRNFNSLVGASHISNITDAQFKRLITASPGGEKIALLSGVSTDTTNYVYISGRDNASGTRVNTLGITGVGIFNTGIKQIVLNNAATPAMQGPPFAGTNGQASGGTLAGTLTNDTAGSVDSVHTAITGNPSHVGFVVISYLGIDDANTALGAVGHNASLLTYNGLSATAANIEEGTYGLWGNEIVAQNASAGTTAQGIFGALQTIIPANEDGVRLFSSASMHATRAGPTSVPSHK